VLVVAVPAAKLIIPPDTPVPGAMKTLPAPTLVDDPVVRTSEPEGPTDEEPDATLTLPDTPEVPEFAETRVMEPDVVAAENPDRRDTIPPV
jgi:hypothetical protein